LPAKDLGAAGAAAAVPYTALTEAAADPQLARLVELWPSLPEATRRAVLAVAESAGPAR
jgi:hypothetical protein